jgi:hypothetical protein
MNRRLEHAKFRGEYFPFLLPLFYFMHHYFGNYPFFAKRLVTSLLAEYWVATVLLLFLFFLLLKNWRKSSLFTFVLLFSQFFFIFFYQVLCRRLDGLGCGKGMFPIALLVIALSWFFFQLRKTTSNLSRLVKFLNVLMVLWIVIELCRFLVFKNHLNRELKRTVVINECSKCEKPDVYLLILDGYAGQQSLTDKFQFNNNDFLSYLKRKNFHVVSHSKSNYDHTLFSMASMLSLDSMAISDYEKPPRKDFILAELKLNQSPVGKFFLRSGYQIHNLSLWNFLDSPPRFRHSYMRDCERELRSRTLTQIVLRSYKSFRFKSNSHTGNDTEGIDLNYNNALINLLMHWSLEPNKPTFVYAHFLMPHYPHMLNEKGEAVDRNLLYSDHSYIGYLEYCNQKIVPIIDRMLSSPKPSIILLMSDHGFRNFSKQTDPKYYFMNLNAVYLPDHNYDAWYDGMSNVNQFRILLNRQFNQNLPLLKDTSIRLMGKDF